MLIPILFLSISISLSVCAAIAGGMMIAASYSLAYEGATFSDTDGETLKTEKNTHDIQHSTPQHSTPQHALIQQHNMHTTHVEH
jgi:hypothetical protein